MLLRDIIGSMAAEPTEIRMAKLEGAYEQINVRLGALEQHLVGEIASVRAEVRSGISSVRDEIGSGIGSVRGEIATLRSDMHSSQEELRRQMTGQMAGQFYWLLTLILGSILIPLLRDLVR